MKRIVSILLLTIPIVLLNSLNAQIQNYNWKEKVIHLIESNGITSDSVCFSNESSQLVCDLNLFGSIKFSYSSENNDYYEINVSGLNWISFIDYLDSLQFYPQNKVNYSSARFDNNLILFKGFVEDDTLRYDSIFIRTKGIEVNVKDHDFNNGCVLEFDANETSQLSTNIKEFLRVFNIKRLSRKEVYFPKVQLHTERLILLRLYHRNRKFEVYLDEKVEFFDEYIYLLFNNLR